jgi:hypothetical protein
MKTAGIILAVLMGFLLVVMVIGSNTDTPNVGETVIVSKANTAACPVKSDTSHLQSLVNQRDSDAGGTFAYRTRCIFLSDKDTFILQIKEPFDSHFCLRQRGKPDCVWVAKDFVVRPPTAPGSVPR